MAEMTVGVLAARTGVTVRTLHHYHDVGVLVPSGRTEAGYRLYSDADIQRLEQIVLLRSLGLSLTEVAEALTGSTATLRQLLEMHLKESQDRMEAARELAYRLDHMLERLDTHQLSSLEEALSTIHAAKTFEKYFDRDQLEAIRHNARAMGPDQIKEAEAEWPRLIGAVRHEMRLGTSPDAPEAVALARRWQELIEMFVKNRPDVGMAAGRMLSAEPAIRTQMGLDADVMNYIARATAAIGSAPAR